MRCARSAEEPDPVAGIREPVLVENEAKARRLSNWLQRNAAAMAAEGDTIPTTLVDAEMVHVPVGEFVMGFDRGEGDERPQRTVFVSDYYIDKYEVTVAHYRACVEAGACMQPYSGSAAYRLAFEDYYTNWDKAGREHYPVNAVSWYQANSYCRWAGKRLPTEAEWEKGARGTAGGQYPWGDEEPDCDRIVMDDGGDGCGQESTWRVGSKPAGASPYGVMDMAGNVWEWIADWYARDFYSRGASTDPFNADPGEEGLKILRGGSLADQNPHIHRTSNRLGYDPAQGFDYTIGFRCARDGDEDPFGRRQGGDLQRSEEGDL